MSNTVRFLILDHSTARVSLVEVISTLTGDSLALVRCPAERASMEIWREIGVPQRQHKIVKVAPSDRKKLESFGSARSFAPPHEVGEDLKLAFLADVFSAL